MAIAAFTLARRLRAGETVFAGWCSLPYPIVAETLGREGFPAVTIEAQHGLWDLSATADRHRRGAPGRRSPGGARTGRRFRDGVPRARFRRRRHHRADDQHRRRRARFRRIGQVSADRRAQLGAASRDHAGRLAGSVGLSARSQRPRHHARDDRDPHRARQSRRDRRHARASTGCSSARPIFPSRCPTARPSTRNRRTSSAELDRIVAATQKAGKIAGAYCHTPERALALAKRGMRFLAVMSDLAMLRAGIAAAMKVLKG